MFESQASLALPLPITSLILRILTLILLMTSLIILVTDSATFKPILSSQDVTLGLKYIYSYRYMLSTTAVGLAYTFMQLPFTIYHVSKGKRLLQSVALIYFDFFGDKVIMSLIATGVGAGFGATYDLKKNLDEIDDILENQDYNTLSEIRPQIDNFLNKGFISSAVLLFGFFCILTSSIISSFALSKRSKN